MRFSCRSSSILVVAAFAAACSATSDPTGFTETGGSGGAGQGASGPHGAGGELGLGGTNVGGGTTQPPSCKVNETMQDALPACEKKAPPNAFTPVQQWQWTAPPSGSTYSGSIVTPLVGNFTDDNGDSEIDLCDTPDVLVTVFDTEPYPGYPGTIYMLAGDTGALELTFGAKVDPNVTPAFGDIDGDGLPEVVAADPAGHLIAFEHDGTLKWTGDQGEWMQNFSSYCTAIALYDLDGDGSVEILAAFEVFDKNGKHLWSAPSMGASNYWCPTPTAADLDGDGKLEVLLGHTTYRADGSHFWTVPGVSPGQPHVANLDDDPEPEVLLNTAEGMTVVEADGTLKFGPVRPTDPTISPNCWGKPGVIHDFDGDGKADVATGTCSDYSVYSVTGTATPRWTANVSDLSGLATGTAFDFLGDGVADAIYADEHQMYVFDGATGNVELTQPRSSGTLIEYPVVADVDNDGSAEIVLVSNWGWWGEPVGPTVTVIKDAEDRWIQARRIWNQHAYHVTNVREDGVIPQHMKNSWSLLNTFRTNSQIEGSGDCAPPTPK
jgi:hypothetical protein